MCWPPQATDQGDLDAAIKAAEDASASNKAARQKAEELAKASNAAWEKARRCRRRLCDGQPRCGDALALPCATAAHLPATAEAVGT